MARESLTEDDRNYIKQRGFEPVHMSEVPGEGFNLPYLLLYQPETGPILDIAYHTTHTGGLMPYGNVDPSMEPNAFIDLVEQMMASSRSLEGVMINTVPGIPIKVIMLGNAWDKLVDKLVEKYS